MSIRTDFSRQRIQVGRQSWESVLAEGIGELHIQDPLNGTARLKRVAPLMTVKLSSSLGIFSSNTSPTLIEPLNVATP